MKYELAKKISEYIENALCSDKIANDFVGKLIVNIQCGGVSGKGELEIEIKGKMKIE